MIDEPQRSKPSATARARRPRRHASAHRLVRRVVLHLLRRIARPAARARARRRVRALREPALPRGAPPPRLLGQAYGPAHAEERQGAALRRLAAERAFHRRPTPLLFYRLPP